MSLRSCFIIIALPLALLASVPAALAETPAEIAAITNAAERGNQGAQLLLGLSYREGRGVPRDARKAFYWIDRSAREHQPYSQFVLGQMYAAGEGTARDTKQALDWWQKSAAQNQAQGQPAPGGAGFFWKKNKKK